MYGQLIDAFAMIMYPAHADLFYVFISVLKRFVDVTYDRKSSAETVDEA